MFKFIRRWLGYDDARQIYRYWDGQRMRRADPLRIIRLLTIHPTFDMGSHPLLATMAVRPEATDEEVHSAMRNSVEATEVCVDAIRQVFDVQTLDSRGLTDGECMALLNDFTLYIEGLKKSTSPIATTPQPTAPTY